MKEYIVMTWLGQRARYELFLHARMNDSITLQIVPIYWLNDVNVKIKYTDERQKIDGEFLIKSLEIPLGMGNTMSITAIKIYPEQQEINSETVAEYPGVNANWYSSTQQQFPYFL